MSITLKKWYAFFELMWRNIDGTAAALAHMLVEIAIGLDMMWNVNGEVIEDSITAKEDTDFSKAGITVSASVGHLEKDRKLNKAGKWLSRALNKFFNSEDKGEDSTRSIAFI